MHIKLTMLLKIKFVYHFFIDFAFVVPQYYYFSVSISYFLEFNKHLIFKKENEKSPPVPYLYQTPKGHQIDLRLFNKGMFSVVFY